MNRPANTRLRQAILPAAALLLVAIVLGIQLGNGGGSFEPLEPADPCAGRAVSSEADGIDGLSERLVLLGIDNAACTLGVSREAFTLEIAQSGTASDAEIDALRQGLLDAVEQMKDDGTLPKASALIDEALDSTELNSFLEAAIRALPASVVDAALKTDDVLVRAIGDLDLRALLANLDDPDGLNQQIGDAVTVAVKDSLEARLRDLL